MKKRRIPTFVEVKKGTVSYTQWNGPTIQTKMEDLGSIKAL